MSHLFETVNKKILRPFQISQRLYEEFRKDPLVMYDPDGPVRGRQPPARPPGNPKHAAGYDADTR